MSILWEEEERERREINRLLWEKLKYLCRDSATPRTLLSYGVHTLYGFRMENYDFYFSTSFLIGFTKERGLLVMEEYGPTNFLLRSRPYPELCKLTIVGFADIFSIETLRELLHIFTNASVSCLCF